MKIVVLTGAGVSAESGVPTFRDADGLWEGHRVEEVATPEAFLADPDLVHTFYDARRAALDTVDPNPAHRALATLEQRLGDDLLVVTQNIDDLHERAGSRSLVHLHGELLKACCAACGSVREVSRDLSTGDVCAQCGRPGVLRPHVVWFGEMPREMDRIIERLEQCDLFVSIGTSGHVYPAAGFVDIARRVGAHTVQLNLDQTGTADAFDEAIRGRATETVPPLVDALLGV